MRRTVYTFALAASLGLPQLASAQWVVEDPAMLAQTLINTYIAYEQQQIYKSINNRIGDASGVSTVAGASQVMQSLTATDGPAEGEAGSTGSSLYRTIAKTIIGPDGQPVDRNAENYRKYEAAHATAASYLTVLKSTEARRQAVLDGIMATTKAVQEAPDLATVQKLQAVASSQIAALNAIDGERSAALGTVLVHAMDNETDDGKQEQARKEERAVDFKVAARQFVDFLTPVGARAAAKPTRQP